MNQSSGTDAYMSLGFEGLMGALVAVGLLKLAEAVIKHEEPVLRRLSHASIFLLCLCAAFGTIGLYSVEVMELSAGRSLLGYGLLASSVALIVTGGMKLAETYMMTDPEQDGAVD